MKACTPSVHLLLGHYKHLCILARPTRTVLEASVFVAFLDVDTFLLQNDIFKGRGK